MGSLIVIFINFHSCILRRSRPGDYVVLQACKDLLCATSSCTNDINLINGDKLTPIQIRIYQQIDKYNQPNL